MAETQPLASRCSHQNWVLKGEHESAEGGGKVERVPRLRDKRGRRHRKETPRVSETLDQTDGEQQS